MARKPRVHFAGALYQVMSRGNQGQLIFKDDRDRQQYLDIFKESQKRFGYRLYAYVLMGNHECCETTGRFGAKYPQVGKTGRGIGEKSRVTSRSGKALRRLEEGAAAKKVNKVCLTLPLRRV